MSTGGRCHLRSERLITGLSKCLCPRCPLRLSLVGLKPIPEPFFRKTPQFSNADGRDFVISCHESQGLRVAMQDGGSLLEIEYVVRGAFLIVWQAGLVNVVHCDAHRGFLHVKHADSSTQGLGAIPTWLMPQHYVQ